jgi:hypothetical protein
MINSKQKGSRIELEIVDFLKAKGFNARRTAQFCGKSGMASDVVVEDDSFLSKIHIEVKGTNASKLAPGMWDKFLTQVKRDAKHNEWVIFHRPNRYAIYAVFKAREEFGNYFQLLPYPEIADFPLVLLKEQNEIDLLKDFHRVTKPVSLYDLFPLACLFKVKDQLLLYTLAENYLKQKKQKELDEQDDKKNS